MSEADRDKWNERYRDGAYADRTHPSRYLADWLLKLPRGRALDVGCGAGRNALYLAEAGYAVDAIDISAVALERGREAAEHRGLTVNWIELDLETGALPVGPYALIVVVRYTQLELLAALAERLGDGGHLLCELHLTTARDVVGPKNPEFRVAPNELLAHTQGLRVLEYREGLVEDPDGRSAALAQLVACRGAAGF